MERVDFPRFCGHLNRFERDSKQEVEHAKTGTMVNVLRRHWKLALYAILLMTAFNFFSHGTQDLYPDFLKSIHGFSTAVVSNVIILYNVGAILGCLTVGYFSERIGRRNSIMLALAITFLVHPGPGSSYVAPLQPSNAPHGFGGVLAGMVFSVLALSGFEAPAPLAQETRRPGRFIGAAVMLSLPLPE